MTYRLKSLEERFVSKTERRGEHLIWKGARKESGHGVLWARGRVSRASHVAWFLATGTWPEKCVLHRCDVPECVLKEHLFLGTQVDNIADMLRKERGNAFGHSKLSYEKADEIRVLRSDGYTYERLGAMFGCTAENVSLICRNKTWVRR